MKVFVRGFIMLNEASSTKEISNEIVRRLGTYFSKDHTISVDTSHPMYVIELSGRVEYNDDTIADFLKPIGQFCWEAQFKYVDIYFASTWRHRWVKTQHEWIEEDGALTYKEDSARPL